MRTALALALLALPAPALGAGWSAAERQVVLASGIASHQLLDALETQEKVRAVIVFSVASGGGALGGAAFLTAPVRTEIETVGHRIVHSFAPDEFDLRWRYQSINALAGSISASGLLRLLDDTSVLGVDIDPGGSAQLAQAAPLVNLDALHALGYTGEGVTVAVLDSGLDTDHADLADDLVAQQCFCSSPDGPTGCCPNGSETQSGAGAAEDGNGHGTNVTGIITSRGTVAPLGGAPDAGIVAIRVLDNAGNFCCSSDITAGLDWIINNRPDVDLVNMSLGTNALFSGNCDNATTWIVPWATAINTLRSNGVLSFASSGNSGSGTSMSAPACIANTISVGAVWDSNVGSQTRLGCTDTTTQADQVTCFSNSNSTTDLFAPGAPTTSTGRFGGTSTYYGTSQASPLAAACAALLLDEDPSLAPGDLETALETSSTWVTDTTNGLSFPRLDYEEAATPPEGQPLWGSKLRIKNKLPEDGSKNKIVFMSKDASIAIPTPESPDDPRCGRGDGGSITVSSALSLQSYSQLLPCDNWTLTGTATSPKGYKYRDQELDEGACKLVLLKNGLLMKALCQGQGPTTELDYDLQEGQAQDPVSVVLTTGTTNTYCAEFGGEVKKDGSDGRSFAAREAGAPAGCP
jgi:subtilisin family serine protease